MIGRPGTGPFTLQPRLEAGPAAHQMPRPPLQVRSRVETCTIQANLALPRANLHTISRSPACALPSVKDGASRAQVMTMHESKQIAAERRDLAEHAHATGAAHHGKEGHLSGNESSRLGQEHTNKAYLTAQQEHQGPGTGQSAEGIAHEAKQHQIASLAYKLWQGRSCPEGSPEEDWFRASEELRSRG